MVLRRSSASSSGDETNAAPVSSKTVIYLAECSWEHRQAREAPADFARQLLAAHAGQAEIGQKQVEHAAARQELECADRRIVDISRPGRRRDQQV